MKRVREIAKFYGATIDEKSLKACAIVLDLPREKVWMSNGCHSITSGWSSHDPFGKKDAIADILDQANYGTREANPEELEYYNFNNPENS